jgi:hypothetical protein
MSTKKVEISVENTFLPIGSVVMLKGATTPLVIIGFAVVEQNKEKIWDYMGVMYPMGYISSDKNLMFDRNQIEKVISEGYSDENEKLFRLELERNLLAMKR